MVKRAAFAVPGDLSSPTGGYGYDRRVIAELQALGWEVEIVIDGLAFGALPDMAKELQSRNPLIALVHHPLAFEGGLSPERAGALRQSERDALDAARGVVTTSSSTASLLAEEYDVPPELITTVMPGTDPAAAMAEGSKDGTVRLLSVGSVVRRKGYDVLIPALAEMPDLPWRLTIAGDLTRDQAAASELAAAILDARLADRIELVGALPPDRLSELYAGSDIFVLASRFEGYGMAFAEALAHGLPVIGTTAGAIPDTVPPDAGVLVEPDDATALTRSLRMLIGNPKERAWLASGARRAGAALPRWETQGRLFAAAIDAASA